MTKYILVSGGVVSGIGKGVIASSTGLLLKTAGLKVTAIKIDPYMNIDAGTMRPTEHGEVYVLNDGGEVDLDLGNYERYLDITLSKDNNITTGKIYREVIEKERRGEYLGKTVQIVPHVTNAIQDWIQRVSKIPVDESAEEPDICIVELGGTVGDIESAPFIEAMRQFQFRVGHDNFALIHVSLVPDMHGEQKTKPTQTTVHALRGLGLLPDLIACRLLGRQPLESSTKDKISMFCHVASEQVIGVHDVSSVYHVPLLLQSQRIIEYLHKRLNLASLNITEEWVSKGLSLEMKWRAVTKGQERLFDEVKIVLVGKYTDLKDSYMSVIKALEHSAFRVRRKLIIQWVESSDLEPSTQESDPAKYHDAWRAVVGAGGILVPGGFGKRGTEGMILAIKWAREQKVPFLGICLGFQMAVIEWARSVLNIPDAHSAELVPDTQNAFVIFMPEISRTHMGGTMRLGLRPTVFDRDFETWSKARKLYGGNEKMWERHRHRYEVNPEQVQRLQESGLTFVGKDEKGERMQILELKDHPFFMGLQAHPELCSRPLNPSPPFLGFIAASSGQSDLEEQIQVQLKSFRPPHPEHSMVSEEALRTSTQEHPITNGVGTMTPPTD
ncbi:CTP synthase N-terminus-domain-containing protein [Suillus plorans]|uniref:CTP synthase n=1 Tax=Suillus plorans TaxID=116603 RepID=A0A9P7AKG6_9AGAM|nr:CTP synthase N-terminus-domain-containing protein [Suillus plorans]KAG1790636.1 CTP synthase N-terminus-domain-containing protein [Suillus plorans]